MARRKKIMVVFGTRPEAIKMAPVVSALRKHPEEFETFVCVTGQHREMLRQVMRLFEIKADYDLDIMREGQDLTDVTTRVLEGMRAVLREARPDMVLVHGDTTTSMVTALAAYYAQITVGHVEAGLRTGNIYAPWPEEINRQITGRISTLHFAPTESARRNLLAEGVKDSSIAVTGNTVIDALLAVRDKIAGSEELRVQIEDRLCHAGYDAGRLKEGRKMVLITGHRRENFGEGFHNICRAIQTLGWKHGDVDFVYPMHMNPNVRGAIRDVFGEPETKGCGENGNMFFIEPQEYLPFVYLMEKSHIVLTDSGGIQEEAPSLGKPVLVMREVTERPEAVAAGTVKLVGTDYAIIVGEAGTLLSDEESYRRMSHSANPYGDGGAASRIIARLKSII